MKIRVVQFVFVLSVVAESARVTLTDTNYIRV